MAVNEGVAPPDFTSTTGQFRALLGDTDAVNIISGIGEYVWFSDAEIVAFLGMYSDNPKRAAARALLTIAGSQALLLKKWSADDLHVDGAAIAEALRKMAKDLQDEADAGDAAIDIFEISYPGGNVELIPEGTAMLGARWGRGTDGYWQLVPPGVVSDGSDWYIDGDGYIVDD